MARNTGKNGFDLDSLNNLVKFGDKEVNKNATNNVDKLSGKDSVSNETKDTTKSATNNVDNAIIKDLVVEKDEKVRVFTYLDTDLAEKLKDYGKQIGHKGGGSSKLVNMAVREFFDQHNL